MDSAGGHGLNGMSAGRAPLGGGRKNAVGARRSAHPVPAGRSREDDGGAHDAENRP
jgi:hypothetical protein